jgi:hypothetical protein
MGPPRHLSAVLSCATLLVAVPMTSLAQQSAAPLSSVHHVADSQGSPRPSNPWPRGALVGALIGAGAGLAIGAAVCPGPPEILGSGWDRWKTCFLASGLVGGVAGAAIGTALDHHRQTPRPVVLVADPGHGVVGVRFSIAL